MEAQQAPLSINNLPAALLGRIFTLTHPRRDGLALLLTCRHWLGVAEAQCPQHLWGAIVVHSDDPRLVKQDEQAALLAGLRRRAACLSKLRLVPGHARAPANSSALTPLWPALLRAVDEATQLHALRVGGMVETPGFVSSCKALGHLTSLQQLEIMLHLPLRPLPLPALRHLSTLTRLERLVVRLHSATGALPADVLSALGSLTSLDLELGLSGQPSVAWQRPDGSGPALRQLRLAGCRVGLPPNRLLAALQQLERLELHGVPLEEGQLDILPQLPRLTSLLPAFTDAVPWPVVLICTGLRELDLGYPPNPPPAEVPAASLPQLTRLTVACAHAGPAWLALPQLRSLKLTLGGLMGALPASLGQCPQLEELEVWNHSLWDVTRAASSLTRLTSLAVVARGNSTRAQGLHEGPYLAGLRQLKHFTIGGPPQGAAAWCLPAFLSAATSLQLLDLGRDSSLWVRGAEDAALLRTLPRLRRVLLPVNAGGGEEAAAAVARIREGLRAGAGADAGSLHAVEVEGVVLR